MASMRRSRCSSRSSPTMARRRRRSCAARSARRARAFTDRADLGGGRPVGAPRGRVRVGPLAKALDRRPCRGCQEGRRSARPARARPYRSPPVSRTAEATEQGLSRSPGRGPASRGPIQIGFSNASMDNLWRVALVHTIEYAAASLDERIERLTVLHAHGDARQQEADIERMIAQGVDGLIVSAVAPQRVGAAIAEAMARGVAVVLVDRGVDARVPRTSFVTADDATIGRLTALWLAERLEGKGSILLLPGDGTAEPAQIRLAAAQSVFSRFGGIEVLATQWTGWRRETGVRSFARRSSDGGRDRRRLVRQRPAGRGFLAGVHRRRYRAGEIPPHTGGDLNLAYKLAIRWRTPLAAVDFPPSMGIKALEVLLASLRG